ncbi:MAG: IS481 family transposase [Desulfobacterales bacterium]|nr:IS481 family transposase [Desulfobacterales bacterium]
MFSRFRKEGRSELLEEQVHDAMSVPEEERKKADPEDAGTTGVASTTVNRPSAEVCLEVAEPEDAGHAPLPTQARDVRSEQPAEDGATEALAIDAGNVPGADAGLATEVAVEAPVDEATSPATIKRPRLMAPRRREGKRLVSPDERAKPTFTGEQRLLLLDTWRRSGLPAKDFAGLVGISAPTLYTWKKRFEDYGPAGLVDQPRGAKKGSRLPEVTRRTILMLKEGHPEWGCQRISDMLARGPALPASASAVARVLREAGYESVDEATHPHPDKIRRFERAKPNQLWQTDLFTFVLKRQNRRVYLVAFMDDHSRFIVSYGLHASQSTALVLEVLEAAIANYGPPEEILTDNGPQYVTWRGKSQFTRRLEKRGIKQIVAKPKRPQTLGKIERFWGTLWRGCIETAVFLDLADARTRIGLFLDDYNFRRPHQGIEGLAPADRFFGAAPEILKTLKERVATNALELARHGVPKEPFYLTGQVDGQPFSVHRAGDRVVLRRGDRQSEEVELTGAEQLPSVTDESSAGCRLPEAVCPDGSPEAACGEPATAPPLAPGESVLDGSGLKESGRLEESDVEGVDGADDAHRTAEGSGP